MHELSICQGIIDVAVTALTDRGASLRRVSTVTVRIGRLTGWFPTGGPRVTRTPEGPTTLFDVPGEYRGRFTAAGGAHGTTGEVFPLTVVVRRPAS